MNVSPILLPDPLDPAEMECRFRQLQREDEIEAFSQAVQARYAQETDNLLLAAWYHRLTYAAETARKRIIAWQWAIPLAVLNAFVFWLLSDERFMFKIYALEHGRKRWIKDIPTFEQEGYEWWDVRFVRCEDLYRIPDGPPIPPDAGTPPVPLSPYEPQPTATLSPSPTPVPGP